MNQPLLTVIVPCYNVEDYVNKCISSIANQTYSNLEILLIDDGSTDSTGTICDAWQERDSRICVIHKQNEGLAYARKTGIEHTKAEYVTFLDADDWIDVNMYSDLMGALLSTNSDIAQCGVCLVYEDGRMEHFNSELATEEMKIVERIEGVMLILESKKWLSWMGTKIYRKHLFDGIVFPKGRGYGEDFIAHDLFHKAHQSVFLPHEYYYYLQRDGSITKATNIKQEMKNYCDFFDACYDRYCFVEQHPEYHKALPFIKLYVLRLGIQLLRNIIGLPQYFPVDTDKLFITISNQIRSILLSRKNKLQRGLKIDYYILKYTGSRCYRLFRTLYVVFISTTNRMKLTHRRTYVLLSDMWICLNK